MLPPALQSGWVERPITDDNHNTTCTLAYEMPQINLMSSKPPFYRIYLLIVWQEHNRDPPEPIAWRFRLEDPRSGQQRGFMDAATLMNALHEIGIPTDDAQTPEEREE